MKIFKNCFFLWFLFLSSANSLLSQQYSIEQYLNIRGATSPKYSFDDSRIYFTMNITGTSQLWYVNSPGLWPIQVTFFKDRITGYHPNPKRDLILVEKDEGGSEYDQFFLMKGDGTEIKMITDGAPKVLYGFGRWSDDGSFFTYYSNKRSPYFYDVYTYNIESGSSKMVFSSDHSNYPSALSADGSKLVLTRSYSTYDNDLYLVDLHSGKEKLITTHDNFNDPAQFYAASFDAAGSKLYLVSNDKNDFFRIGIYDMNTEKISYPEYSFLREFRNNDVSRLYFPKDRTKMLVMINDRGYDRIFLHDLLLNNEITIPQKLNSSSITAVSFSNNNDKMIIGINSSSNPSVLYQWDMVPGVVEQITYPTLAGVEPSSFVEPELISYSSFDGLEIPAFVYRPENSESKKLPCIISIHGGPESQSTYGFAPIYQYFVNAGYVIVEPNVRGSTGYGKKFAAMDNVKNRENSVKDIASLVEYLKSRVDIDPGRIAVYGGSYGGYMVLACLTLYPELFAAGIDVVGISNFVTFLQNTGDYRRNNRESEYGSLEKDRDFLESISPLGRVKNIRAPLMIIHGRNDPRVPVGEAEQMHKAIIDNGGVSELLIYEDEGHGVAKQKNRLDLYPKIVKFLNENLKK
ncbi:MAG TPA: S9 family peptidase [Ignavibacteria bacterium]|nr:S9 family peptidase [Ignavibacteria bacterium]HRF66771.1 S9 family peptidase [Ignavibacteria bacterium]HRJ04411.1 S9 family peptidase [Ignavibacteria bacterium]